LKANNFRVIKRKKSEIGKVRVYTTHGEMTNAYKFIEVIPDEKRQFRRHRAYAF
jgi:hypothetical protein